ncbi:MAG TPA: cytochrome c peroxidase [Pseudolabrys sp.]|nr:cytochrome c peroxidase [Pseudolabrys sp.]
MTDINYLAMAWARRAGTTSASIAVLFMLGLNAVESTPVTSREAALPVGSELNEGALDQPTELFAFEAAGGKRSYMFNLGDMLFSSSAIFGGVARQAGISCNTCHQGGAGNARLYVPGLSKRPGTFDTTGALFNPKADNGVFDPVTAPSLRGAKYLAPYGHDGRFSSLREFVRNVIVNEFAGAEPSPQVLDALVTYINEISFLPNPNLGAGGRLTDKVSEAARRGERLFNRPFPHDAAMSCASCHQPSSAFVDHRVHDVGSGGWFKTKTLINANFNAPYFHDGRFDNYDQVVSYFDGHFDLGLGAQERSDLVAYLEAVGGAKMPYTRNTVQTELEEIEAFASVLATAIGAREREVISLTVESVGDEWRELGENFPSAKDTSISGGLEQRVRARSAVREVVLALRRVAMAASADDFDQAGRTYADYRKQAAAAAADLRKAEPWSLFNPAVREAHFRALRQLVDLTK